nr:hypothetical protein [uncultured Rhodopila sp.]
MRTSTLDFEQHGYDHWCQIPRVGTATGVSMTTLNNKVYMVWRGTGSDETLYWSRLNSTDVCAGWEPQHHLPNSGTASSPAIMAYNGTMIMVWRGVRDDKGIYWSRYLGNDNWSPQGNVPGVGTDSAPFPLLVARPGLAVYNGLLYMAWRGVGNDQNIYWTTFDGKRWQPNPVQHRLGDRGTFASPALGVFWEGAVAIGGKSLGQLIMVWPGIAGAGSADLCLYWSKFEPAAGNFGPQQHMATDFHAVNQVALQNVSIKPNRSELFMFRGGDDTFCQGPALQHPPDMSLGATLGAIDNWGPPLNPGINDGWSINGPFTAHLSGGPALTVGP